MCRSLVYNMCTVSETRSTCVPTLFSILLTFPSFAFILFICFTDSKKTPQDVGEERAILREMLEILEKRDKLVVLHDQLELKERREEREIENRIKAAHAAHAGAAAAANVDVSAQQFIHIPGLTSDTSHV